MTLYGGVCWLQGKETMYRNMPSTLTPKPETTNQGKETPYRNLPNPRTQEDYRASPHAYAPGKGQPTVHL